MSQPDSTTVLVVEDDPDARGLLCEMLVLLGYRTTGTGSAEEAIALLEAYHEHYDILLADIGLPGMSGIALAEMAVRRLPELRVVFASGSAFLVADKTDFEFRLLPKPYNLNQLQHALSDAPMFETGKEHLPSFMPAGCPSPAGS